MELTVKVPALECEVRLVRLVDGLALGDVACSPGIRWLGALHAGSVLPLLSCGGRGSTHVYISMGILSLPTMEGLLLDFEV